MTLIHRKPSVVLIVAVALLISSWVGLGCSRRPAVAPPPVTSPPVASPPVASPPAAAPPVVKGPGTGVGVQDIIIVDQSELDSIRAKYLVSESQGEITGLAACASGTADDACTAAARQQLREEAKKRGFALVVVTSTIVRQTFPPQVSLRARLHRITPR